MASAPISTAITLPAITATALVVAATVGFAVTNRPRTRGREIGRTQRRQQQGHTLMESPLGCNNCPQGRGTSQNVLFSSLPESLKVCRWQFPLVVGPCKLGGIWPRHSKRAKNPGVFCERMRTTIGLRTGPHSNVSASMKGEKTTAAGDGARDGTKVEAAAEV